MAYWGVIGPGVAALPYSQAYIDTPGGPALGGSNCERLHNVLQNGSLVLFDYSHLNLTRSLEHLVKNMNFSSRFGTDYWSAIKARVPSTIYTSNTDLRKRDLANFPDNMFDFLDVTLSDHHGTLNLDDIIWLHRQYHRILKPNGRLFLGTGKVDMDSESILCGIGMRFASALNQTVVMRDYRWAESGEGIRGQATCVVQGDKPHRLYFFEPGKEYSELTGLQNDSCTDAILDISSDGLIKLSTLNSEVLETAQQTLIDMGKKQVIQTGDSLYFPVLDSKCCEDSKRLASIRHFYTSLGNKVKNRFPYFAHHCIGNEWMKAEKGGGVECYACPKAKLEPSLREVFPSVEVVDWGDPAFIAFIAQK